MRFRPSPGRMATAFLLALLAAPALAQEPEPAEPVPPGVTACAWCSVIRSDDTPDDPELSERRPGCDVGAGVALYRWRRLSWVAVVGTETAGTGLAWVTHRPPPGEAGAVVAVAVGVVAPYDTAGVYVGEWAVALGATFGVGRSP